MPSFDLDILFDEILRAELDHVEKDEFGDYIRKWGNHEDGILEIEDATIEYVIDDWLSLMEVEHKDLIRAIKNTLEYDNFRETLTEAFEVWWSDYEKPRLAKEQPEEDDEDDTNTAESDSE